jgi:hypothetical protein
MEVRVAIGMAAYFVPFILHAHHKIGILFGRSTHYKKRCFHRVIAKNIQYSGRIDWIRAVINC